MMDSYALLPDFIDCTTPPGEFIVDGSWLNLRLKLMFMYGSLPRPPGSFMRAGFFFRCNDMKEVNRILQSFTGIFGLIHKMETTSKKCRIFRMVHDTVIHLMSCLVNVWGDDSEELLVFLCAFTLPLCFLMVIVNCGRANATHKLKMQFKSQGFLQRQRRDCFYRKRGDSLTVLVNDHDGFAG